MLRQMDPAARHDRRGYRAAVEQYRDGKLMAEYASIADAARAVGANIAMIRYHCLHGGAYRGFTWRFGSDEVR